MKKHYDVIVLGGGLSGTSAALAAARRGAEVILVEKNGFLGGTATACLVNPFMKWSTDSTEMIEAQTVNQGIFLEILNGLKENGGLSENNFNEEILKLLLDRMCAKCGAEVLFHTVLSGVSVSGRKITSISLLNKGGNCELTADTFIDCSGDGDLAAGAGCGFYFGREDGCCQPMTLSLRIANVNIHVFFENLEKIIRHHRSWRTSSDCKFPTEDILPFKHIVKGVLHINSTRITGKNPLDAKDKTSAEIIAREQAYELYGYLKKYAPGCENSDFLATGAEIGVRESRCIKGLYTLTKEDILSCVKFPDSIACGCYPIDIHNPSGNGTSIQEVRSGDYYTIPYRCLVSPQFDNLVIGGRCISMTHEAQAACRVMPIVCSIGEGAGAAAATAKAACVNVSDADIKQLRLSLEKGGARVC